MNDILESNLSRSKLNTIFENYILYTGTTKEYYNDLGYDVPQPRLAKKLYGPLITNILCSSCGENMQVKRPSKSALKRYAVLYESFDKTVEQWLDDKLEYKTIYCLNCGHEIYHKSFKHCICSFCIENSGDNINLIKSYEFNNLEEVRSEITRKKTELNDILESIDNLDHHLLILPDAFLNINGNALLTEQQIVKFSEKARSVITPTGVYFLIKNQSVVYIGQSVNVYNRVQNHTDKDFDKFVYIECDKESLNILESLYIHTLKPILNGNINNDQDCKVAPINFNNLVASLTRFKKGFSYGN